MNADALNKLPQFIDGSGDSMWPVEPGNPVTAFSETRYVLLSDVQALLDTCVFQSVGYGAGDVEYFIKKEIPNGKE